MDSYSERFLQSVIQPLRRDGNRLTLNLVSKPRKILERSGSPGDIALRLPQRFTLVQVSSLASSSEFSRTRPASFVSILPLFPGSMSRHSGDPKASLAASTAAFASCLDALGTSAIVSPLDGSRMDDLAPVVLSFHSPAMSIFIF